MNPDLDALEAVRKASSIALPLKVVDCYSLLDANDADVIEVMDVRTDPRAEFVGMECLAFIVSAVNAHQPLIDRVRELEKKLSDAEMELSNLAYERCRSDDF